MTECIVSIGYPGLYDIETKICDYLYSACRTSGALGFSQKQSYGYAPPETVHIK